MAVNIVKKLSMKVLVGNVKAIAKPLKTGESVELAKVVGIARGLKVGTSNFGDWTALMGDFVSSVSVGEKKGQQFRTGQLFLPDVALNLVESTVANIRDAIRNGDINYFVMKPERTDINALHWESIDRARYVYRAVDGAVEAGDDNRSIVCLVREGKELSRHDSRSEQEIKRHQSG